MTAQAELSGQAIDPGQHVQAAFGLTLEIEAGIEIPGVASAKTDAAGPRRGGRAQAADARPRTRIAIDPAALHDRWGASDQEPMRTRELRVGSELLFSVDFAQRAGYLLDVPGYGRVLISPDGRELLCEPEPGCEQWAAILSAQALPLAATAQGLEVLHAAAVLLDGVAVLFSGPPGAGKSSLAGAFVRLGARLMSDDAVALEVDTLLAHPGTGLLALRAAENDRLSAVQRSSLGRTSSFGDKHGYTIPTPGEPAPLAAICLLERAGEGPATQLLDVVDPFDLLGATFNLSVRTPERLQRHLHLAAQIAARVQVHRVRVQPGIDATQLAALLLDHLRCCRAERPAGRQ